MYLFDTDILSSALKPRPAIGLRSRFANLDPDYRQTSSVNLAELYVGAFMTEQPRRGDLLMRIESLLGDFSILPFDETAARIYGPIAASLRRRGLRIGDADTRVAAIAAAYGLTLVTGNVRHFERVPGLRVENWL